MRIVRFEADGKIRLGLRDGDSLIDLSKADPTLPSDMKPILEDPNGLARIARAASLSATTPRRAVPPVLLPPIGQPNKIICVGLNYVDHAKESPYKDLPKYPVLFARYANSLVGHGQPLVCPVNSFQFDWEGEVAAIIGKRARHVSKADALDYVAGYSLFNDGSVRDYQFFSHQWLIGKSFDKTGPFGPDFVTADELPPGVAGLTLTTRINGNVMQSANTSDMIFSVQDLIAFITEGITLDPGDVIVTGTPAGVGFARKPPIFMKPGDTCEIEVERIGLLSNMVVAEQ
jgi:acylpyruvate hydrolase